MNNSIFNAMGGGNNQFQNLMAQVNQLRSNPVQFLMQRKYNVPNELSNNPQGIVQHLLNTGQMSQDTYNRLQSQVSQMFGNNR